MSDTVAEGTTANVSEEQVRGLETTASSRNIYVDEETTERFGQVYVLKTESGDVLDIKRAEGSKHDGFVDKSRDVEESEEIKRVVRLASAAATPTPLITEVVPETKPPPKETSAPAEASVVGPDNRMSSSSNADLNQEPNLTGQQQIAATLEQQKSPSDVSESIAAPQRVTEQSTISSGVAGFSASASQKSTDDGKSEQSASSSFRIERAATERFGNVYIVKNDEGHLIGMFPKSDPQSSSATRTSTSKETATAKDSVTEKELLQKQPSEPPILEKQSSTSAIPSGPPSTTKQSALSAKFSEPAEIENTTPSTFSEPVVAASTAAEAQPSVQTDSQKQPVSFGEPELVALDESKTLETIAETDSTSLSKEKQQVEDVLPVGQSSIEIEDNQTGEMGSDQDVLLPTNIRPKEPTIIRKISDVVFHEDLYEFGNFRAMPWYRRTFYSIERDVYNWYGSFMSLINHGWGFESFMTLCLAVASTCFFCYYRTPEGTPLAARLDFSIIGSALVFPVTFLIGETFRRRESAIQRLASIKALICQMEIALLTWRWKGTGTDMGTEWEDRVHQTLHHLMDTMTLVLKLPTWNTNRHIYTAQGRDFKARVIKRERELTRRMALLFSELHWYVEDLKEAGLPANEASRINQYNNMLQTDFEALAMVKSYRTPNVSRSFVRIMVLVMPIFYGPYFAWVSGSIGGSAQTNPAFAIALTIVTVFVLLGLVRVQRSMEDPFTSHFPGDVIDMISEQLDTETRLNLIVAWSRERKKAKTDLAGSTTTTTA